MCAQHLSADELVKVKLTYYTNEPITEAALFLSRLGVDGPYTEEVRVLVPRRNAFSDLSAYEVSFQALKDMKIVPETARLVAYAFDDEDTEVLGYET